MEGFWLLGLGLIFVILSSWILPWINKSRITDLEKEVRRLRDLIEAPKIIIQPAPKPEIIKPQAPEPVKPQPEYKPEPVITPAKIAQKQTTPSSKEFSFEQTFGAKLPVWVGGIALILAGFFLVKYSIETGLITEEVRTLIGLAFGFAMLYSGNYIRRKDNIANGTRISQALTGAAIADLYICIYATTNLYHLVPQFVGFIGMAAVTATAVIASLRHGAPIAVLGLVGGFLTPAVMGSHEPDALLLFSYLYFVITGLMLVIRKQEWWKMSFPVMLGAFAWVAIWLTGPYMQTDGIWLGLFLIATSVTMVAISRHKAEEDKSTNLFSLPSCLNYFSLGGAMMFMGMISYKSNFDMLEWGMFGLFALGGFALAFYNSKIYGFVPLASMAVNIVMLYTWKDAGDEAYAIILTSFAVLHVAAGYFLMWRTNKPAPWAYLCAATAAGYFLLAYFRLHEQSFTQYLPLFWGYVALVLCGLSTKAAADVKTKYNGADKQILLAVFTSCAAAFLALALTIELKREFLSVAIAAEVLALAWISSRLDIKALRAITGLAACVFGFLLMPQIILLAQLTAYSLAEAQMHLQDGIPIVNWPLFQLGVPALMFALASHLLRREKDSILVAAFEIAAISLIGVMGYYLTRHAFHMDENILFVKAGFIERGVITNILFIYGLSCIFGGRYFGRSAIFKSGIALCGVALFRIFYFELISYNPLWANQNVGASPLLNGLLLLYGLPIIWSYLAAKEMLKGGYNNMSKYLYVSMLVLAFTFVSLNVRQIFQGSLLNGLYTTNAETYTYSIAWLLLGIALLFIGALKKDQMVRIASLVLLIITAGKVFLYDASELTGLYRVFSFLGLGISLLGISWFYTRFVFTNPDKISKA